MNKIYTIGFTKKSAQNFFEILKSNDIKKVVDIRLNNTSQLAGFTKFPDIKYFIENLINIEYVHDPHFSPCRDTLKKFKSKKISWDTYVKEFNETMLERKIEEYIIQNYADEDNLCLLCSEVSHINCHRSLVANLFKEIFKCEIIHL